MAPGSIYAQRGTLSFYWKAREPVGTTPFPLFRVGYADHTSWDMAWLRIDWNGKGFDAFVTDDNLSRVRVSTTAEGAQARPVDPGHLHLGRGQGHRPLHRRQARRLQGAGRRPLTRAWTSSARTAG